MAERLKKALLKMRQELLKGIDQNMKAERTNFTNETGDFYDSADTERDRQLFHLLSGREREKLNAINEALEKIEDGTYGICEECEQKINRERLKIMPFAKYCVACQSQIEKQSSMARRNLEEEFTYKDISVTETEEMDE
jgi:DnaK suppressor protein